MGLKLNLTDADTSGGDFEAIPANKYLAEIVNAEMDETGENAKMGEGIPMLKIQWKIIDGDYENRRVFSQYVLPPDDFVYDVKDGADKLKKTKGMFVRFLMGIGYTEDELQSDEFDVDEDDYVGRSACIVVGRYQYPKKSDENPDPPWRNDVKGVKPVEEYVANASAGSLI